MSINKSTQILQESDMDGFEMERIRKRLLKNRKLKKLRQTYSLSYPTIKDENTGKFWDKKFKIQDGEIHHMESDRNYIVSQYIQTGTRVLDLAVGRGLLEEILYPKYANSIELIGTDITVFSLRKLKIKYPKWKFLKSKLYPTKFEKNSFDIVCLLEVLEHIKPSETFKVLNEIYRVLKTKGTFIISVPINEGLEEMYPENPNSHLRVYSKELLEFELNSAGFNVIQKIELSAFSKLYYFKKMINRFIKIREPNNLIFICTKK